MTEFYVVDEIDSSVSDVLSQTFGSDFGEATLDQKLVLVEAVARAVRRDIAFHVSLYDLLADVGLTPYCQAFVMPDSVFTTAKVQVDEGIKLLAALQVAIVESFQF